MFCPEGMPPGEWLTHDATQFDTVEADVFADNHFAGPAPGTIRDLVARVG